MSDTDHLTHAIAAHGAWKTRLREAIESGTSIFSVETVRTDDQCEFGRWLYGSRPATNAQHWEKVRDLHARFHQQAAGVLEAALKGETAKAEALMEPGGPFLQTSADLTLAIVAWKDSLRGR